MHPQHRGRLRLVPIGVAECGENRRGFWIIAAAPSESGSTVDVNGKKVPTVDFAIHGKNVSSKEILVYSLGAPSLGLQQGIYDDYFKAGGTQPGDVVTETVPGVFPSVRALRNPEAKVFYVQFADRSTWGDTSVGAEIRANRLAQMQFYDKAIQTYSNQGEAAFIAFLQSARDSGAEKAATVLHIQKTSGTAAAIEFMASRQKRAKARRAAEIY